jgi:DNA ligase (NAD+)
VEKQGGKILSGVSSKLNYLVVGEDAGSKLEKARKIAAIKILTEKEFLKFMEK